MTQYVLMNREGNYHVMGHPCGNTQTTSDIDNAYIGSWEDIVAQWKTIFHSGEYEIYSVKIGLTIDKKMDLHRLEHKRDKLLQDLNEVNKIISERLTEMVTV